MEPRKSMSSSIEPGMEIITIGMEGEDAPRGSVVSDVDEKQRRKSSGSGFGKKLQDMLVINNELEDGVVQEMETGGKDVDMVPIDEMQPGMSVDVDMIDDNEGSGTPGGPSLSEIAKHKTKGGDDDIEERQRSLLQLALSEMLSGSFEDEAPPMAFNPSLVVPKEIELAVGWQKGLGEQDHRVDMIAFDGNKVIIKDEVNDTDDGLDGELETIDINDEVSDIDDDLDGELETIR